MLYSNYNDETRFGGLHGQCAEPQPRLLEVGRFAQVQYFTTNFSAKLCNYLLVHKTLKKVLLFVGQFIEKVGIHSASFRSVYH